jgi:4-amino-4-deoxy-L-arabinose transferase-like glycosyltransferase
LDLRASAIPIAIVVLAAVLRLWRLELDAQNPFYDAAVRSMGSSWHNFFFGAFDPGGSLAIDKPPVDLWLQVASTKLLGFTRTALALPEALGGIAAVALLYAAVARACGRIAGNLAALALAVLPISVLTSRSDTMDSVMSALLIAALWSSIVAVGRRQARYVLLSAALVGVAFNVKLTQALIPLPALALLWWAASSRGRRIALGAASAAVLVAVAMTWAFTASLTPLSERPFPIGSHTGSIYRAIFVFNGIERLTGSRYALAPVGFASSPGVTRLVSAARPHYATLIGLELVAALALALAAAVLWLAGRDAHGTRVAGKRAPPEDRAVRWLVGALVLWLTIAYVLFSAVGSLQPRYLEAMSPAVAGLLGIALAYLLRDALTARGAWLCAGALAVNAAYASLVGEPGEEGVLVCLLASAAAIAGLCVGPLRRLLLEARSAGAPRPRALLLAAVSLALFAAPADASIDLVEERAGDANPSGSGSQFSSYLRAHRGGARYETAAASPLSVAGLIVQDAQPVLIMRDVDGKLVSLPRLQRLVREGAVRFIILPNACSSGRHCSATTAWSVRHAVMVRPGLYRYR